MVVDLPEWVTSPVIALDPGSPMPWRLWKAFASWKSYAERVRAHYGAGADRIMRECGTTLDGFLRLARELPEDRAIDDRAAV